MPSNSQRKTKCPDCIECQMCSENRCRLCRKSGRTIGPGELGPCFTHGQYLEWKEKRLLRVKDRRTLKGSN